MGNPLKGEVSFQARGETLRLAYTIDALCTLEDALDLSVGEIGARMGEGMRLSFLRTVFHAGLLTHQKDMTIAQAGEVIDDVGLEEVGPLIAEAFSRAFSKAGATEGGARPPRKAPSDGTGPDTSASGVN